MLSVARALVSPRAYASVEATLASRVAVLKLGPTAMAVLQDTLAKGVVQMLVRLGGARRRLRPGVGGAGIAPARVFEVRPAPAIAFSPYTFELVRWLTVVPLGEDGARFEQVARTLGDELCAYLALRLVEGSPLERAVAASPGLRTRLTWLGFARSLARHGPDAEKPVLEGVLATEDRRTIVECLEWDLARRWAASARWDARDVVDAALATRVGTFERAVLEAYLDEVEALARWDLVTFLVDAAADALPAGANAREIAARAAPRVRREGTLRARSEAVRGAGSLFRAAARLGRAYEELALVRFIDDGYEAAQATLSSWEKLGRDGFSRARAVVSVLESLDVLEDAPARKPRASEAGAGPDGRAPSGA